MAEMIRLDNRQEWLEKRKLYIGGSEASAILGLNPYKTNVALWEEKSGIKVPDDISDKPCVVYGVQAEDHLRELFKLDHPEYKLEYEENNLWINEKYPFAHASLDGWITDINTGKKGILEIKTSTINSSIQWIKWQDQIPDNYYVQIIHYLMVTEFDFAILKAHLRQVIDGVVSARTKHYYIEKKPSEIRHLAEKEEAFWQCVKTGKKPSLILPEI